MNFLKWLYSVEYTVRKKITTICGHKFEKISTLRPSVYDMRAYMLALRFHPQLEKYRGIYEGKDILIVGSGPSIKFFKPMKDTINIGLNYAFRMEDIEFDYIFVQDNVENSSFVADIANYRPDECKKFIGLYVNEAIDRFRPSDIAKIKNREIYILNSRRPHMAPEPIDISAEPFAWYSGTIFGALQFALFTNPRKIYLAGFDCSTAGNCFMKEGEINGFDHNIQYDYWCKFAEYAKFRYADNKIVSINPVNLKGLFEDVYTKDFVAQNPELAKENIKIIDN